MACVGNNILQVGLVPDPRPDLVRTHEHPVDGARNQRSLDMRLRAHILAGTPPLPRRHLRYARV